MSSTNRIMCGLCDMAYDPEDPTEAAQHQHEEPQSGPYRAAWLASRLSYADWKLTADGIEWMLARSRVEDREELPFLRQEVRNLREQLKRATDNVVFWEALAEKRAKQLEELRKNA